MNDIRVVCVGSAAFSGSGRIMSTAAAALADAGMSVHIVSLQASPFHRATPVRRGATVTSSAPALDEPAAAGEFGAFPATTSLHVAQLAEECVRSAICERAATVVFWGHYLFPYGLAARIAADVLESEGRRAKTWLTPAGSDVWDLGCGLRGVGKWLLDDPRVRVLTYSAPFGEEVTRRFGLARQPDVFTPSVDGQFTTRLAPKNSNVGASDEWVITTHSNLRPVKRFDLVLDVCERLAEKNPRKLVNLYVAGPPFSYTARAANLRVKSLGVRERLAEVLSRSCVEVNFSIHDSFNMSIVESACLGVPVLTTDCVGAASLLARHGCVRLIPTEWARGHEVDACAAALGDVLDAPSNPGRRAVEALRREVSADQLSNRLASLMEIDARDP